MGSIVYYGIIKPISLLPYPVLLVISRLLFVILYPLLGYRKKVVFTNLQNAFPQYSPEKIHQIGKQFYLHLCDLIIESIRVFSITKEDAIARCRLRNPEALDVFFEKGQNVIMAGGHYNNWEMLAVAINPQMKHHAIGIYSPLKNQFFNNKMIKSRSKFGLGLWAKKDVKPNFAIPVTQPIAVIFGFDQSPSSNQAYWNTFLHQDTAFQYGVEKYARQYNYPVVFTRIHKVKRGYYEIELELVEENPAETPYGEVLERLIRLLEKDIRAQPQYWLWTHKRWKRKRANPVGTA